MTSVPKLLFVIMLILIPCTLMIADGSSAVELPKGDIKIFSGEADLDDDMFLADGSDVTIMTGTVLRVHSFTLDFGKDSTVRVVGQADISSEYGHIVFGDGTEIKLIGEAVHDFDSDVTFTYDGTMAFDVNLSDGYDAGFSYRPRGSDDTVVMSWDDYVMTVGNPMMGLSVADGNLTRVFGFSTFELVETTYDDGQVATVSTITAIPEDSTDVLSLTVNTTGMDVAVRITEFLSVTEYRRTGIVDTTSVTGIAPAHMTVDPYLKAHLSASAENAVSTRDVYGQREKTSIFDTITLEAEADLYKIKQLLEEFISGEGEGPNIITYLNIGVSRWTSLDPQGEVKKQFDDISIIIDGSETAEHYLTFTAYKEGAKILATSTKLKVDSYSISKDLVLDIKTSIESFNYSKTDTDGSITTLSANDLLLEVNDLDVRAMISIYSLSGTIGLQEILDNGHRFYAAAGTVQWMGTDGSYVNVYDADLLLMKDSRDFNTLGAEMSSAEGRFYGEGTTDITVERTELYVESDGSLDECIAVFISGTDFTTDAHTEVELYNSGFSLIHESEGKCYRLIGERTSSLSPTFANMSISVDNSLYRDETDVKGQFSAIGFSVSFLSNTHYADPEGYSVVDIGSNDMSGSFEIILSDGMSFGLWLQMPLDVDITYYDIVTCMAVNRSSLAVTHGKLSVEDFDYREQGLIDILDAIANNDFEMEMRVDLTADSMDIYKGSDRELFNTYSDISLFIKNLGLDMKRGDSLLISLEGLQLDITPVNGDEINKSISRLDIVSDLSGKDPEKGLLERGALPLLVIFTTISAMAVLLLILLRIKRPDFFRSKEGPQGEE